MSMNLQPLFGLYPNMYMNMNISNFLPQKITIF